MWERLLRSNGKEGGHKNPGESGKVGVEGRGGGGARRSPGAKRCGREVNKGSEEWRGRAGGQ